jgi:hypothetical protein
MKNIISFNTFGSTDLDQFNEALKRNIQQLESNELEVEVQYSVAYTGGSTIFHSALVLGRK